MYIGVGLVTAAGISGCKEKPDVDDSGVATKAGRERAPGSQIARIRGTPNTDLSIDELVISFQRDATTAFKVAEKLPRSDFDELDAEAQGDLQALCRTVAWSRDVPVDDRANFVLHRLPPEQLPYVLDDLIMDINGEELLQVEAIIEAHNLPVEEPRLDLYRHIALRWCHLGQSEEWLMDWAASLKAPEEQAEVKRIFTHHFGREISLTTPNKTQQ